MKAGRYLQVSHRRSATSWPSWSVGVATASKKKGLRKPQKFLPEYLLRLLDQFYVRALLLGHLFALELGRSFGLVFGHSDHDTVAADVQLLPINSTLFLT